MNPPHGRRNPPPGRKGSKAPISLFGIEDWIRKAAYECLCNQNLVVALLPARTDSGWWHDWASRANERDFLRGRVRFESVSLEESWGAPFPSVIATFEPPSVPIDLPFLGAAA